MVWHLKIFDAQIFWGGVLKVKGVFPPKNFFTTGLKKLSRFQIWKKNFAQFWRGGGGTKSRQLGKSR